MSWFGFVVVALASYRATRVFTSDSLTEPWRDRLYAWAWDPTKPVRHFDRDSGDEYMVATSRGHVRHYVYELLTCAWCLGVWVAAVVYCAWRWGGGDVIRPALIILAAAGVQGFLASRHDA